MIDITAHGDSVYRPSSPGMGLPERIGDTRGPIGRWLRCGEPGYDEALNAQVNLEASWFDARDELGDG